MRIVIWVKRVGHQSLRSTGLLVSDRLACETQNRAGRRRRRMQADSILGQVNAGVGIGRQGRLDLAREMGPCV